MISTIFHHAQILLRVENLSNVSTIDVLSFIVVCILIIALFYSLITLRSQNILIAEQNDEILRKNEQLQIQNKKLQKINEEKNNLIGIVSHDLKSPFNRIFALLNLLKITSKELSDEQAEYLSKMHQVIKDGLALIRNLLDIRAIEDEGIKMVVEEIGLVRLVKETLKANKPLADIKKIKFKLISEIDTLKIISDKLYLSRILENLISNSLKFSEHNTIIEIKISKLHEDSVSIEILDQGPGISTEDITNLFKKFRTLSARPTDGESSTGLGLSIVKTLIEKLEGTIECNSVLGDGARFVIRLPLKIRSKD